MASVGGAGWSSPLPTRLQRVKHASMSQLLSLFPAGSTTDDDGMLIIGGCRADDLAAEFGTPVLVVAEEALRERAQGIRS